MSETGFQALISLLSIAGLIILYRLSKSLRVDNFRQDVFNLRDDMFMYAAQGNIAFDHPAYTTLRSTMNGFIRFGHQMTWPYFLARFLSGRPPSGNVFIQKWENGKKMLSDDPEALTRMEDYYNRLCKAASIHMILMNMELLPLVILIAVFIVMYNRTAKSLKIFSERLSHVELPEMAYNWRPA